MISHFERITCPARVHRELFGLSGGFGHGEGGVWAGKGHPNLSLIELFKGRPILGENSVNTGLTDPAEL